MKIHVGSKNQTKVQAVREAVKLYPKLFPNSKIVDMDVDIDKFGHPKDIHETVEGAVERAKKTFKNCSYSIGIESGLIEIPYTRSGLMEISVCAVFDEKNYVLD